MVPERETVADGRLVLGLVPEPPAWGSEREDEAKVGEAKPGVDATGFRTLVVKTFCFQGGLGPPDGSTLPDGPVVLEEVDGCGAVVFEPADFAITSSTSSGSCRRTGSSSGAPLLRSLAMQASRAS